MFKNRKIVIVLFIIGLLGLCTFTGFAQDQEQDTTQTRIEITNARTSNSKTFRNADGTETTRFSFAQLHYRDQSGAWREIDNAIEGTATESDDDGTPFGFHALRSPMKAYLPKRGNGWVRLTSGSSTLSYKPIGNNQLFGKRKKNQVSATNVWKNSDIFYTFHGNALKEEIVLRSPDAPKSFEFLVRLNNLTMTQDYNQDYIFTNLQGEKQFAIPKFVMIDALGKTSDEIDVRIENQGGNTYRWTVLPNKTWLEAYNRAYPVIIDPTTIVIKGDAQFNRGYNYYFLLYIPSKYPTSGTFDFNLDQGDETPPINNPANIETNPFPVRVTYKAWAGDGGSDHGSTPGGTWTEYTPPSFRVTDWDPANMTPATSSSARGKYLKRLEDGNNVYHSFTHNNIPGQYSGTFNIGANRAALVEMRSGKWTWWGWWSWGIDCGFEITYQNESISPPAPALNLLPPETYGSSVTLAWQAPTDTANPGEITGGIDRYYVQQSTDPSFTVNVVTKDVGNVTTYRFDGLTLGTTYYYRVYCRDIDGNPTNMNPFNATSNPSGVQWSRITRTKCVAAPAAGGPAQPIINNITPGNYIDKDGQYFSSSKFPTIVWSYSSTQTAAQLAVVQYLNIPMTVTEYPVITIDDAANEFDSTWNLPDGKYVVYLRTANSVSWSKWSPGKIVTIDTVGPTISDVLDENVPNTSDIQISFSSNEGVTYELNWGNSADTVSYYTGNTEFESGGRSVTVYGGAYPIGAERYYQIKCKDKAGNEAITPIYQVGVGTGSLVENADPDHFGVEGYWTYQDVSLGKAGTVMVNVNNGNLLIAAMDFSLPGRGISLTLVRYYNSLAQYSGMFGKGWRCNYEMYLEQTGSENRDIYIHDPDGSRHLFQYDTATSQFIRPSGDYRRVIKNDDTSYQVIEKSGTINYFSVPESGLCKLTAIEDRFGNKMSLSYTDGLLTSIQEPSGYRKANFHYTTMGGKSYLYMVDFTPLEGTNPSRTVSYTYNANSLYHVYYPYSETGKIQVEYGFDTFMGLLISAKVSRTDLPSEVKNATSFAYKSSKRSIASVSTSFDTYQENFIDYSYGPSVKTPVVYKFDYNGSTTKVKDPKSQAYTYTFTSGLCQKLEIPLCSYPVSFTYDGDFNLLTTTQKKLVYDGTTETLQDVITENTYYSSGNLKTVTADKNGKKLTTTITYEPINRNVQTDIASITDPRNKIVNYINIYDPVTRKLTSMTIDPEDNYRITHTFNQYGERTDKDVKLDSKPSESKYHFGYGYLNGLLETLSNEFGTTTYYYTVYGERKKTTDANGVIQEYTIDPSTGLVNAVPAPKVGTSTFAPYNAVNNRSRFTYDINGNKIESYDAKDNHTSYFYDALNQQHRVQSPYIEGMSQYNSYCRYDASGNLLAVRDYNGISTLYEYDGLNRRTKVKDYSGIVQEELTYDETGRVKNRYDGKGNLTTNYYDSVDNLVCTKYYEGGSYKYCVTYKYDANGNLARKTAPLSSGISGDTGELVTVYQYDASNRPTSIATTCAENSHYNQTIGYTYEAGQLKTMTVTVGNQTPKVYTYSYDEAQRLDTLEVHTLGVTFGQKIKFTYYDGGQRKSKVISQVAGNGSALSLSVAYNYDVAYRLADLNYSWGDYRYKLNYQYNEVDKITSNKVDYKIYSPRIGQYIRSPFPETHTYEWWEKDINDEDGDGDREEEILKSKTFIAENKRPDNFEDSYTNTYKYDKLGRMKESTVKGIGGYLTYEPDDDFRDNPYKWHSISSQTTNTNIDPNGNLTDRETISGEIIQSKSVEHYNYDNLNRMKSSSNITSTNYDGNGNLTRETYNDYRPLDTRYEYGLDNQLLWNISETRHETKENYASCYNKTEKWYTYELGGRMLREKLDVFDSTDPNFLYYHDSNVYFYYSHDGSVATYNDEWDDYSYSTRLGGEILTVDSSYCVQNIRGDVVLQIYSDGGEVSSIRDYDSGGQMLFRGTRYDLNLFGFTGGLGSGDGLWKLGARFYDSSKGSFIQQDRYLGSPDDPLSLNRYVYCGLDPVNFVDPTGFSRQLPWQMFEDQLSKILGVAHNTTKGLNNRIVDFIKAGIAWEAKCVQYQYLSSQIKDFLKEFGSNFNLVIGGSTKYSRELLQSLLDKGASLYRMSGDTLLQIDIAATLKAGAEVLYATESAFIAVPDYMINGLFYKGHVAEDNRL